MKIDKISLVGLGKLGLPLLCTFAKNGQRIVGYDVDRNKIKSLENFQTPFYEPNLDEYLNLGKRNIEFSYDMEDITSDSDVSIILVNTPSNENGEFSNEYIFSAIDNICYSLKKNKKKDHLFIISSTVMPGTHKEIIDSIENKTGRILNENFGVVYIPDLVALGSVINDFEDPDLLILGESSSKYGDVAEKIYKKIIKNNAPIVKMSLIESEITKVSLNAYITMKISFANFIGNISEKFECRSNKITEALGYDKRISPYYIRSGLSFGGTCFPRDTWAFIKMCDNIGLDAIHIKSTQKINEMQNILLLKKVNEYRNKKIGIFGLSFKPNTSVTTESAGFYLYETLKLEGVNVVGFDPLVNTDYMDDLQKFVNNVDVIVITHNTPQKFENIFLENKILINPWEINFN